MNRRETIVLCLILAVVLIAAIVYFQTRSSPPERMAPPFFYEIDASDIVSIRVEHEGLVESFVWDEEEEHWRFDDETEEVVDEERWGGMPVLLAGPRIERTLPAGLDLADVGLDPPMTTVVVGLEPESEFRVLIGRLTPNGRSHYVKQSDNDTVFLVNSAWGEVISRVATEPPRLPVSDPEAP